MSENKTTSIVIVDDHELICRSLKKLLESFQKYKVIATYNNGAELQKGLIDHHSPPDVILLDVNMPILNGKETMAWLKDHHPNLKVLILSMDDDEEMIKFMLKKGARGYISKDIDPSALRQAIDTIIFSGFYYSDRINNLLLQNLTQDNTSKVALSDTEKTFLELVCTELTYKEIASKMFLSPKTIDGYREKLFKKTNVKSRTGLVLFAIKEGIFRI